MIQAADRPSAGISRDDPTGTQSCFAARRQYRRSAARRPNAGLPRAVFDYVDGGADGEITLRENTRAFEEVTFRPRNAVAVSGCDLRTKVLGAELSMPVLLAPIGFSRMLYPQGEVTAARAAGKANIGFTLTTISGSPARAGCGCDSRPALVSALSRGRAGMRGGGAGACEEGRLYGARDHH